MSGPLPPHPLEKILVHCGMLHKEARRSGSSLAASWTAELELDLQHSRQHELHVPRIPLVHKSHVVWRRPRYKLHTLRVCVPAEEPKLRKPQSFQGLLANPPNPFPTRRHFLYHLGQETNLPLPCRETLSLSFKALCYINIL